MARNDESGEIPPRASGEWRYIEDALQLAVEMAMTTANGLDSVVSQQIRTYPRTEPDPRISSGLSPSQARILSLLEIHFRLQLPDPEGVANLRDAYRRIHERLASLRRTSFRLVSDAVARRVSGEGRGDTFGYVMGVTLPIFLNERYFSQIPQHERPGIRASRTLAGGVGQPSSGRRVPGTVRYVVEGGGAGFFVGPPPTREDRAGVILHEAVHTCYRADGAVHRAISSGERVTSLTADCNVGYEQITTHTAALNDAYVFQRFASCVHRAAAPATPSRR